MNIHYLTKQLWVDRLYHRLHIKLIAYHGDFILNLSICSQVITVSSSILWFISNKSLQTVLLSFACKFLAWLNLNTLFFAVICAYWSENWRLTLSVVLYFISLFSVIVGRNSWNRRTVQKMAFCSLHTVSFFACLYSLETWAIFLKECLFTFWRKSGNYLVQFTYLMFILEVVCYIN